MTTISSPTITLTVTPKHRDSKSFRLVSREPSNKKQVMTDTIQGEEKRPQKRKASHDLPKAKKVKDTSKGFSLTKAILSNDSLTLLDKHDKPTKTYIRRLEDTPDNQDILGEIAALL